jgi:transglutaminase-like putative cysteine protease
MIDRIKQRFKKHFDWYAFSSYFFFLILILLLVFIIVKLDRGLQLESLRSLVLQAAVFGLLVSTLKRIRGLTVSIITVLSGIIASFLMIGNLYRPLVEFLRSSFTYLTVYWHSFFTTTPIYPDPEIAREKWTTFEQATGVLFERLGLWLSNLPEPAYDPVSMNLIWGIALWIISIWIFWFVVKKKRVLAGIFPPLIIITNVYRNADVSIAAIFWILGICLLLNLLAHQSLNEDFWKLNRLSISLGIRRKTIQYAFLLSAGLVVLAGTITSPRLDEIIDEIRERQKASSASSQGSVSPADDISLEAELGPSKVLGDAAFGRFPNTHLVGSGPELAETEVMYVKIDDPHPESTERYYLRSATYNTYTLHGWLTADKGFILFEPASVDSIGYSPNEKLIYQEVTLLEDIEQGNLMYSVGEIAVADVPYYATFHTKFKNDTYTDIFATVTQETEYTAYSIVPHFGEEELRQTSQDYPAWITSKYLQIPEEVPDRVYNLALRLTATEPTPYDRALAIEQFLRQFEYTLDLEEPPDYHDIVDYFLFELQKGYCDYFASSMVVLSRAAGIPARLVTGYTTSTYDLENDLYIVTADQAHSWAELYFRDFGWVPFEATPGRPALDRLEQREEDLELAEDQSEMDTAELNLVQRVSRIIPDNLFALTAQLLVILALGIVASHWIEYLALKSIQPSRMFPRVYQRIRNVAKGLRLRTHVTDTPLEFSEMLAAHLNQLSSHGLLTPILDTTPEAAAMIIRTCNQAAYSKHFPTEGESQRVVSAWRQLRWRFFLARILILLNPARRFLRRLWNRLQ